MKDGYYTNSAGVVVAQPMVFPDGPNQGVAKGLKQVCLERFGSEAIKGKKQDGLGKDYSFCLYEYTSYLTFQWKCWLGNPILRDKNLSWLRWLRLLAGE